MSIPQRSPRITYSGEPISGTLRGVYLVGWLKSSSSAATGGLLQNKDKNGGMCGVGSYERTIARKHRQRGNSRAENGGGGVKKAGSSLFREGSYLEPA